ncbi:hypothetical protein MHLP_02655 [Candidatus Mycoplasma haematolamae str. Purdue]|uniref:Uncharacterized protein n=1 Tax=Mycoplasma haematolamae (strain Purdue) TaxID=1212765 RepID=I7CFW1_MYCHA|nr:hypothetical protein [Candidatus Mycoplasma haematolamae]AFO52111.1 hypothetical protein MHLP_02655 [Candidatus Mycoplasma haematolamae str. Purdue]
MISAGLIKFLGSGLALGGVVGGSYAAFGPFGETKDSKVTVFEVLKTDYIPELKIICENKDNKLTVLDLSLKVEDFQFKCNYRNLTEKDQASKRELTANGAIQRSQSSETDKIVCTLQAEGNNKYRCVYTGSNGEKDKALKVVTPSFSGEAPDPTAKYLRPS